MAATRNKRTKRSGFAVESRKLDGAILFRGGASSGEKTQHQAAQEALLMALIKARKLGYQRLFVVSNDRYLVNLCNNARKTVWLDRTFLLDLHNLHQQGLITKILFVPKIVVNFVLDLAVTTTRFPVHCMRQNT